MRTLAAYLLAWALLGTGTQAYWQSRDSNYDNTGCSGISSGGACSVIDLNFSANPAVDYSSFLTLTRASSGTNLQPASASGFAYTTFGSNVLRTTAGSGLLVEEARTNQLINSAAPATQTTGSLANGTYTLWVNGSGSAQMSLGTAVGCGTGTATQGSPVSFTTSGAAGTCIVTVVGSLNAFQLELGAFGTSLIVTTGTSATRAADSIVMTGTALSTFQGAAGSSLVQFGTLPADAAQALGLVVSSSGTDLRPQYLANDRSEARSFNGSVALAVTLSVLSANKYALGWSAGGRSLVINNGTVSTDANTIGSIANLKLGGGQNTRNADGYISRLTLWNVRISDANLKILTQ